MEVKTGIPFDCPGRMLSPKLGYKSERHGVACVKNEISRHVSSTFAMRESDGVLSD